MVRVLAVLALALAGAAVAVVAAGTHRSVPPLGVILVIAMVAAAAVFARAWQGWWGVGAFGAAWAIAVYGLSLTGPGGSVLIAQDALGYAFALGGTAAIVIATLLPPSWIRGRRDVEA